MACAGLSWRIVCLGRSFPWHLEWKQIWRPDSHLRPPGWEYLAPTPQSDLQGKKGEKNKKYALATARGTIHPLIGNLVITGLSAASLCELPICGCVINILLGGGWGRGGGNPAIITQAWKWFACRRCSVDFQSDVTVTCVGKKHIFGPKYRWKPRTERSFHNRFGEKVIRL